MSSRDNAPAARVHSPTPIPNLQLQQASFHLTAKVCRPLPWVQQLKPGKWITSVRAGVRDEHAQWREHSG